MCRNVSKPNTYVRNCNITFVTFSANLDWRWEMISLLKFTTNLANQIVYWVLLSLKFLISLSVQTCLNFKYGNVEISIIGYSFWKARWWQTHWYGSHITKLESASILCLWKLSKVYYVNLIFPFYRDNSLCNWRRFSCMKKTGRI